MNGKVRTGQGGWGSYFWTVRQRSQCQTVSLCCGVARAGRGGDWGLKVAARTSSADRKREQDRDGGRKEVRRGHGNLV